MTILLSNRIQHPQAWQNQFTNFKTDKLYKEIEPTVTTKIKFTDTNRKKGSPINKTQIWSLSIK